jgi:channel protein (hemolysin III family)
MSLYAAIFRSDPAMQPTVLQVISHWGIRDPVSMLTHLSGALVALVVTTVLVQQARQEGRRGRAVAVYGACVVAALAASAVFHHVESTSQRFTLFLKIDHAAIFLVVAGTGTAIYEAIGTRWSEALIAATWGVNLAAITIKLLVWPMAPWMTAMIYIGVGWVSSAGLAVVQASWQQLYHFMVGSVVLTVGAVVFVTEWPVLWPGVIEGHEVFHVLVIVGLGFHGRFVYEHCTRPAAGLAWAIYDEDPTPALARVAPTPEDA